MTSSDLTTRPRSASRSRGSRHRLLPALLLVIVSGCEPVKPCRRLQGRRSSTPRTKGWGRSPTTTEAGRISKGSSEVREQSHPRAAESGSPWTPPATKLPRSLVEATALLFESGVADPRGCDYREIEVEERGFDGMEARKARGFVLPERPGEAGRFAVGWDGVVRPVLAVGAKADLEADVRALAVVLRKSRESPQLARVPSVNVDRDPTDHRLSDLAVRRRSPAGAGRAPVAADARPCSSAWAGPTSPSRSTPPRRRGRPRRPVPTWRTSTSASRRCPSPGPIPLYSRLIAGPPPGRRCRGARRRPPARPLPQGGRGEGRGAGLEARRTAARSRPDSGLRAECESHHRAPGRSRAPGRGSPARAGPAARRRSCCADRGPDPRLRPDPRDSAGSSTSAWSTPAKTPSSGPWWPRGTRPSGRCWPRWSRTRG